MINLDDFKYVGTPNVHVYSKTGKPAYASKDGTFKLWIVPAPEDYSRGPGLKQVIAEYKGVNFVGSNFDRQLTSLPEEYAGRAWYLIGEVTGYVAITQSKEDRILWTATILDFIAHCVEKLPKWVAPNYIDWAKRFSGTDHATTDDFFYHGVLNNLRGNGLDGYKFSDGALTYSARPTFFGGSAIEFEIKYVNSGRGLEIRNHFAVPFGKDWTNDLKAMLRDHSTILKSLNIKP